MLRYLEDVEGVEDLFEDEVADGVDGNHNLVGAKQEAPSGWEKGKKGVRKVR